MFIEKTFQDFEKVEDAKKPEFLRDCVCNYKGSKWFKAACEAERYSQGDTKILKAEPKTIVKPVITTDEDGKTKKSGTFADWLGNTISSNIFGRLVNQRVQFLFQNGLNADEAQKKAFGIDIDRQIESAATYAVIHGESYLVWNYDKARNIKAASSDGLSGMFTLVDEMTNEAKIAVRFWQIDGDRPLYMHFMDKDGTILYKVESGKITEEQERRGHIESKIQDAISTTKTEHGYSMLPVALFKANESGDTELTPNIKSKIDLLDKILSDFGDNLERMEGIYWVIKNFGGTANEARAMLAELEAIKTAVGDDDNGMDAHPETVEAPYAARQFAIDCLEKQIYKDFMAMNFDQITGGALTNVAIETARASLDLAANLLETQAFDCILQLVIIMGKPELYDNISKFQRQKIANQLETVQMVYSTSLRNDITREAALGLTGLFEADQLEEILKNKELEDVTGFDDEEALEDAKNGFDQSRRERGTEEAETDK